MYNLIQCITPLFIGLFYFTLGNVSPRYRSRLSSIQLVIVVENKFIKEYRMNAVLEPFVKDVARLVSVISVISCMRVIISMDNTIGRSHFPEYQARHADVPQTARVLLEYGAEKDGYWNSKRFLANVKDAMKIAEYKYPPQKNTLVFIFDQSSCHRAYAENALNVTRMNVRPGGKQPCMQNTVWAWTCSKDGVR